jgi:hypothetical protein
MLAGGYGDFAAWAERDKASSTQLLLEMAYAKSAHDLAAALKNSATRLRKITSELIEIVHHHPELSCLADLGLDEEALRRWSQQHPDAGERRTRVPEEALQIAERIHYYTAVIHNEMTLSEAKKGARNDPDLVAATEKIQPLIQELSAAKNEVVARYRNDPEVAAAAEQMHVVLQENERRLMITFK